ncbi:MAG: hypothetical protein C4548_00955 [Desulfobacteraceae bacterium]|nr:MAG: hypothetical protein C4548_00955 [Desulfobacteraceae bacterium]
MPGVGIAAGVFRHAYFLSLSPSVTPEDLSLVYVFLICLNFNKLKILLACETPGIAIAIDQADMDTSAHGHGKKPDRSR